MTTTRPGRRSASASGARPNRSRAPGRYPVTTTSASASSCSRASASPRSRSALRLPGSMSQAGRDLRELGCVEAQHVGAADGERAGGDRPGDHPREVEYAQPADGPRWAGPRSRCSTSAVAVRRPRASVSPCGPPPDPGRRVQRGLQLDRFASAIAAGASSSAHRSTRSAALAVPWVVGVQAQPPVGRAVERRERVEGAAAGSAVPAHVPLAAHRDGELAGVDGDARVAAERGGEQAGVDGCGWPRRSPRTSRPASCGGR